MRIAFVALLAIVSAVQSAACASGSRQGPAARPEAALVGSWTLVSFESRTADGGIGYPLGRAARGRLSYDAAGHMSAHLMNPERPAFASGDLTRGSDAEVRAAMGGYIAYYGTYSVDLSRGVVTHHVEGALFPNWIGSDQIRNFQLDDDRLTITTPSIQIGGKDSPTVLVWERAR